jgi:hypothetical protein
VDHIIVLGEMHLRRVLKSYADYYNSVRTHRSLNKDAPASRPVQRTGVIRSRAILGGLHNDYACLSFGTHNHLSVNLNYTRRDPGPMHRARRIDCLALALSNAYVLGRGIAGDLPGGAMASLKTRADLPMPDMQMIFSASTPAAAPSRAVHEAIPRRLFRARGASASTEPQREAGSRRRRTWPMSSGVSSPRSPRTQKSAPSSPKGDGAMKGPGS